MKKALRISGWTLSLLLLLLLAALVAVQSPRVQTALGHRILRKMKDKVDADISFQMISVRPFDAITLDDVVVVDRHPLLPGADTLASLGSLSAKFSVRGLLGGKGAYLSQARVENAQLQLVMEPDSLSQSGSRTNLQRIFRLKYKDPNQPEKGWGNLLSAREVVAKNVRFRLLNPTGAARWEEKGVLPGPEVIDWNNLDATLFYARAHNVRVAESKVFGSVDSLKVRENRSGYAIEQASAHHVLVGQQRLRIDRLSLRDAYSDLHLNRLQLDGKLDEYSDFVDAVSLDVDIREDTRLSMQTVSHFAPNLDQMTFRGRIKGKARGFVSDMDIKDLSVEDLDHSLQLRASGRIMDVTHIQNCLVDVQVKDLSFTLDGLAGFIRTWAPQVNLDLSRMAPGERFAFSGTAKGPLNRLQVNGGAGAAALGSLLADVTVRNTVDSSRPILIDGRIATSDLDIGAITGISALGPLTLTAGLDAALKSSGPEVRIDSLKIERLSAMGYDYTGISAAGNYAGDAFDGRIIAADPNLNFLFQGTFNLSPRTDNAVYRFYASLGYADLHALHLDKRPQSKLQFQASSNFIRTRSRDLLGDISISGITLESATGRHEIGDISVKAHANDNLHRVRLKSDFINGSFVGEKSLADFANDLRNLVLDRELPALLSGHARPWEGTPYELSLQVRSAHDLLEFLAPGVYVANPTDLSLKVDTDGIVRASVESGRLALREKYIKDLKLTLDNAGDVLQAELSGSTVQLARGTQLKNNRLAIFADNGHLGMGYSFDNGEEEDTRAEVYLSMDVDRDQDGLSVRAKALPSNIYYRGAGWGLSSGDILYKAGDLHIGRLLARHDDETLLVDGGYSPTRADTLSVRMEKFDIQLLNTLTGGNPPVAGYASGHARILSPVNTSFGLVAGITCDSTFVSGQRVGKLQISSRWDDAAGRFVFNLRNILEGRNNLRLSGTLDPKTQNLAAALDLHRFNLAYAAPLLSTVFSTFSGNLTGRVEVEGPLRNPDIRTPGLELSDGLMALDFTRARYHLDGTLGLDQNALYFKDIRLTDEEEGTGRVAGSIGLGGFTDLSMDTHVSFDKLQAMALPKGVNPTLYGNVYATGRADITGPLNRLVVDVNATTEKQGDLHLPLGSSSGERDRNLLVFTEPEDDLQVDPYELMMAANEKNERSASNLTVRLTARATPAVTAYIDIGDENSLNAKGSGTITMEMQSAQHSFALGGDYTLSEGSFHFSAMNLVSRDFTIQNGSTVRFNDSIMDTDLNVKGQYVTKASLANLISATDAEGKSSTGNRRTVYCGIDITGKLSNPEVSFSIDIPDLSPSAQVEVQSALNSEDKIQKQFLYLLIASSFLPTEESGITSDGSEMLFSNVSSIMSGQINNIFEKLNIPLDLGLNYQATQEGKNLFDVAVSTQLFNNRVIVNGTVGNKQRLGTPTTEIAGDIDIEIKISRNGALRVTLFSHSADQFSSYLDNSQRNGAGITYQREFNSFGQFFRNLFSTRAQREERMARILREGIPQTVLQIDSTGKAIEIKP